MTKTSTIITNIRKFIEKYFPINAKSWRNATDELMTIASRLVAEFDNFYGFKEKSLNRRYNQQLVRAQKAKNPGKRNSILRQIVNEILDFFEIHNDDQIIKDFYRDYNEWFEMNEKFGHLNESQQDNEEREAKIKFEFLIKPVNQFKFDCGVVMENLINPKAVDMPISLQYHINNSANFDDFIDKITKQLAIVGQKITQNDIERLKKHIERYAKPK